MAASDERRRATRARLCFAKFVARALGRAREARPRAEYRRRRRRDRRRARRTSSGSRPVGVGKYGRCIKPQEPDPERWLPKKQRSYNKRFAGRKGAKGSASKTRKFSGAQGGDASDARAAKLDMYAKHQAEKAAAAADEEEKAGGGKVGSEKQQKRGGKKGKGKGERLHAAVAADGADQPRARAPSGGRHAKMTFRERCADLPSWTPR